MQSGWVIVYVPGGDIYQLAAEGPTKGLSATRRAVRTGFKTVLACAQLYWWLRS